MNTILKLIGREKEFFTDDIIKGKLPKKRYTLTHIISVAIIVGTWSEVTPWAIIWWDMDEKKKYSLPLSDLFSEVILYNQTFTLSVTKEIFGTLSFQKLRTMLATLNVSTKFSDYGMDDAEQNQLRQSLRNNQRAGNSLVSM